VPEDRIHEVAKQHWTSWRTLAFLSSSRSSLGATPDSFFGRPPSDRSLEGGPFGE